MSSARPYLLLADFDETLTANDTIAALAKLAYDHRAATRSDTATAIPPWSFFVDAYVHDLDALRDAEHPRCENAAELVALLPKHKQQAVQRTLEHISHTLPAERASIARIQHHRALAGVPRSALSTGRTIDFRPDAISTLADCTSSRYNVCVLSVNWCRDMIRASIVERLGTSSGIDVVSSDLVYDADDLTTGDIDARITTGLDKLREWSQLRSAFHGVVGVGDSLNDVPYLVASDVGILVAPSGDVKQSLAAKLGDAGIRLEPLGKEANQARQEDTVLYVVKSWSDIRQFLARYASE
ncbi:hypothetical protein RI367_002149 [Sorochytrium milnesiophthora]